MDVSISAFSLWKKRLRIIFVVKIYYHFEDIKVLCLARLWFRIWRLKMSYLLSKFIYIFCDVKASENLYNIKYWQSLVLYLDCVFVWSGVIRTTLKVSSDFG